MMDIEVTLAALTLEEKARLCSGAGFNATYDAGGKVPSLNLVDGPAGVRRQGANQDMFGTFVSNPATCFPSGATLAEGWDPELTAEVGAAIGEECRDQGVDVILGPSNNIKRSPLCGRNFEYYSEDPLLAGKLAAGYVRGVQSKGVGACVKCILQPTAKRRTASPWTRASTSARCAKSI
ncbi:MAG: glycoside hydrolase family 3 N-terminal domain-containing protein [Bifidobacterium dentium]